MNNYQKVKNTLSILKFSVLLAISIAVVVLYCAVFGIMGSDGLDAEFAQYKTEAQTVTKTYAIEESGVLHFFNSESDEAKLTVFTNTLPRLNIVNDDGYFIEITANEDIHGMLDIKSGENSAHISFMTEFYNRVHENDASYDYDYGLYIDCTVFEITVHAPISALYADVKTELDFDVAKAEKASISLERGVKDGNIYNIDSSELFLTCSGTSDFKISGRVSGYARIMAFHDAHIDARDLFIKDGTLHISRAIGGFSYILRGKPARVPINIDVFGAANFIEAFVFIPPVIWAVMLLRAIIKKKSQNKESNTTVS